MLNVDVSVPNSIAVKCSMFNHSQNEYQSNESLMLFVIRILSHDYYVL